MRIGICSLAAGDRYREIVRYGIKTKEMYAEKQGYDLLDADASLDPSRPIAWSKIKHILRHIDSYDYIVWIDADTFIMNLDVRLEDLILGLMGDKDIMIARDWKLPNTGVMFCKNTQWTKDFLTEVYDKDEFTHHPNWEQGSFIHCYDTDLLEAKRHVLILEAHQQNRFNSYWYTYDPNDCFILHLPGCWRDDKNKGLDQGMNQFCPIRMEHDTDETYAKRMFWLKTNAAL